MKSRTTTRWAVGVVALVCLSLSGVGQAQEKKLRKPHSKRVLKRKTIDKRTIRRVPAKRKFTTVIQRRKAWAKSVEPQFEEESEPRGGYWARVSWSRDYCTFKMDEGNRWSVPLDEVLIIGQGKGYIKVGCRDNKACITFNNDKARQRTMRVYEGDVTRARNLIKKLINSCKAK